MAQVKVRIGAALDRSVDVVFGQMEKRSQRAAKTVERNLQAVSGKGGPYRQMLRETDVAMTATERAVQRSTQRQRRTVDLATRDMARAYAQIGKVAEREMMRQTRAQMRAQERFASRTSHRATRFFWPNAPIASGARRVGSDLLRGAGVNFDLQGSVSRAVGLSQGALGLAQQERISTGKTGGARGFVEAAQKTGDELAVDPSRVIAMMRSFTGKTGEFTQARELATPLAKMATAAGADLEEMGDAAGYVFNQLKHLPDAGQRTIETMRSIVGQTAVGAVEMKDYATQLGRIAAQAQLFQGDAGTNISKLSALTQLSIETGGATSAADAARAVSSFGATFQKQARIDAFKGAGVELFTDDSQTQLRDPFEILKESIHKTGGNIPQLAGMFMDVLGRKPLTALSAAYRGAGGGDAGMAAVEAQLQKYMRATLDAGTETANLSDHLNSTAAKAQHFQNQLDRLVGTMVDRVVPALEDMAPTALKATKAFTGLVNWAATNPGEAIVVALSASIARAGLESALRAGIERAIAGTGGTAGAGGGLGALGNLSAALTITAAAVTLYSTGKLVLDELFEDAAEGQRKAGLGLAENQTTIEGAKKKTREGTADAATLKELEALQQRLIRDIAGAETRQDMGAGTQALRDLGGLVIGGESVEGISRERSNVLNLNDLKEQMLEVSRAIVELRGATLNVNITNQPSVMAPEHGRSPPPGRPGQAPGPWR